MGAYVCGIDIGTSGVKVIILRKDGFVSARSFSTISEPVISGVQRYQDADLWWYAVKSALKAAVASLKSVGGQPQEISSLCIDATSGTIVPVDENINPVYSGIMYNDASSKKEAEYLNDIGQETINKLGYKFNSSFALPKILHIKNNYNEVWSKTKYILHQADYIAMKLRGRSAEVVTDASNALKTGYDILSSKWPEYIKTLDIFDKLPRVVAIGEIIGIVDGELVREFGFSSDTKIIAGMTDSIAACVASGARVEGDMNTTLGSTITWKILSSDIVNDNEGRIYSHLHPSGCFLPGGAGNSGGRGIKSMMDALPEELTFYASKMEMYEPSQYFSYPLPSNGERFPFINPDFMPFTTESSRKGPEFYKSLIEGASCIERMGYETFASLGANIDGYVWTTGGGAMVDLWMKIRANVLNRVIIRARYPESAYGAALVAAMRTWFNGDFIKTADSFIIEDKRFEPTSNMVLKYQEYYNSFLEIVEKKRAKSL